MQFFKKSLRLCKQPLPVKQKFTHLVQRINAPIEVLLRPGREVLGSGSVTVITASTALLVSASGFSPRRWKYLHAPLGLPVEELSLGCVILARPTWRIWSRRRRRRRGLRRLPGRWVMTVTGACIAGSWGVPGRMCRSHEYRCCRPVASNQYLDVICASADGVRISNNPPSFFGNNHTYEHNSVNTRIKILDHVFQHIRPFVFHCNSVSVIVI